MPPNQFNPYKGFSNCLRSQLIGEVLKNICDLFKQKFVVFSDADDLSLVTESRSTDGGRVSGICTKLSGNHPRGVMQFIPSIR